MVSERVWISRLHSYCLSCCAFRQISWYQAPDGSPYPTSSCTVLCTVQDNCFAADKSLIVTRQFATNSSCPRANFISAPSCSGPKVSVDVTVVQCTIYKTSYTNFWCTKTELLYHCTLGLIGCEFGLVKIYFGHKTESLLASSRD